MSKFVANKATKDFMKKVGAIPDRKYPDSGVLEFDDEGNVSWYSKGVKKTLQKSKVPSGVGLSEEDSEDMQGKKSMSKNSVTESYKVFPDEELSEDKSVPSTTKFPGRTKKNAFSAAIEGGMKYVRAIASGRDK